MKIVSFPHGFEDELLEKFKEFIRSGSIAEGKYYNQSAEEYVLNKKSIPVNSCGSALFVLLAYQKYVKGKTHVFIQSNTMRGVYTVARLLDMKVTVVNSSVDPGFMAMDPAGLQELVERMKKEGKLDSIVTIYSVIGGYLSPAYPQIELIHRENNIPLIIDMAHGHYLDRVIATEYTDLAFSFYATKILPAGEGGLISTSKVEVFEWMKRFLIYDRFNYELEVGINLRPNELTAYFIYLLMKNPAYKKYFATYRVAIAKIFKEHCIKHKIKFLDPDVSLNYNGYKFIIFDPFESVKEKNTILTQYPQTSPVFNVDVLNKRPLLEHWCPPTYPSLYEEVVFGRKSL